MPSASETLPASPSLPADSSVAEETPRVVLLPDARFFVRAVPVVGALSAADVAAQVELALETLSPFPVAQLYHGHFWTPGSAHALAYAAYRRRFTAQETEEWGHADLVIPTFVSILGEKREAASAVVISGADGLTAVYWGESGSVPSRVASEPVGADVSEEERAKIKDELVRSLGGSRSVVEQSAPIRSMGDADDAEFEFQSGDVVTHLPASQAGALDVRDKAELAARRRARNRDLWLWRGFLALVLLLLLAGLSEVGLVGLRVWQDKRVALLAQQQPDVDKIMKAQTLATRIEKLTTERLRPFEMLDIAESARPGSGEAKSIQFQRTSTSGYYALEIVARTAAPGDISLFETALRNHPSVAKVDPPRAEGRSGDTTFTIMVYFKPEALKSAKPSNP